MADRDRPTPPADDLIERLRTYWRVPIAVEAADRIERLEAQVAEQERRHRVEMTEVHDSYDEIIDKSEQYEATIADLVARRDHVMAAWDADESPEWTGNVIQALREAATYNECRWAQMVAYEARMAAVVEGER